MKRIVLVHWHAEECAESVAGLQQHGYDVEAYWRPDAGTRLTRSLSKAPPAAVVIDVARLLSHGRAIATWLRERKALRAVPIVFVPGSRETAHLREALPDAVYASWARMKSALTKAIAAPPRDPIVPTTPDYSGTPLPKKLGLG
ncbi:MAG: hypothetical protein ABIP94_03445 [Planctomycetota bacterium]